MFLCFHSQGIRDAIVDCLPDHSLAILVPVLERFVVCIQPFLMITQHETLMGFSWDDGYVIAYSTHVFGLKNLVQIIFV